MTHNLILNYGLYRKMEIYVSEKGEAERSARLGVFSDHTKPWQKK